jgi:polysaccharide deacetylase family protein (PEP-CTERM system associated)
MVAHPAPASLKNALSVDVEDYFQVQALESSYPRQAWPDCQSRVERNTDALLEVFAEADVKATFFTLGWIAERHPGLVRRIADEGHEVASHGYQHDRVDSQTSSEFRADVSRTRRLLEDISGVQVLGYRAATFSIGPRTPWAWRVLEEEGYAYSSSVYPVARDFYGSPDAPRGPYRPDATETFLEIPISTVRMFGRNYPCGGGGFFRLLPYTLSRLAIDRLNRVEQRPAVFYIHPWEIDPHQPRAKKAALKSRLRHYTNLSATRGRLVRLAREFHWDRVDRAFGITPAPRAVSSTSGEAA